MSDEPTTPIERWKDNPYAADLGDMDVMTALTEGPARLRALVDQLTPAQMASSYAPGKWTAAQLLVHLAQCEFVFGARVRMALTEQGYTVQPFDQDAWLLREAGTDGRIGFWAYYAMRYLNLQLFETLSLEDRRRVFTHPERGPMIVEWILETLAGHERHHLPHFETIANS
jgi:DinB superfamily